MAGEDRLIEPVARRIQPDRHAAAITNNPLHGGVEAHGQAIAQLSQHGADILPRAAGHHVPLRAMGDIQQTMMLKEAQKQRQWKTTHLL